MKVLVASKISPDALDELRSHHDVVYLPGGSEGELIGAIADREALIFRSGVMISAPVLSAGPALRLIIRAGSGYDNVDLDHLAGRKLRFVRIPGPGAKAVAELSFTLLLALARQIMWADREWRGGNWVKSQAAGRLLTGRTLGIVGAGNIGARTGLLGAAWGMSVVGCVEHPDEPVRTSLRSMGIELADFPDVLRRSDYLSIHVPLQESTVNLIGAKELAEMPQGGFLVNLSRGGVVDEAALRNALVSGHLAGAALDVHQLEGDGHISGLADLDNVILTPHIGASTIDSQKEIGNLIVRCVDEYELEPVTELATVDSFIVM